MGKTGRVLTCLAAAAVRFLDGDPAVLAGDNKVRALVAHALRLLAAAVVRLDVLDVLVLVALDRVGRALARVALAAGGGAARGQGHLDRLLVRLAVDGVDRAERAVARAHLLVHLRAAGHLSRVDPLRGGGDALETARGVALRRDVERTLGGVALALARDWAAGGDVDCFLELVAVRALGEAGRTGGRIAHALVAWAALARVDDLQLLAGAARRLLDARTRGSITAASKHLESAPSGLKQMYRSKNASGDSRAFVFGAAASVAGDLELEALAVASRCRRARLGTALAHGRLAALAARLARHNLAALASRLGRHRAEGAVAGAHELNAALAVDHALDLLADAAVWLWVGRAGDVLGMKRRRVSFQARDDGGRGIEKGGEGLTSHVFGTHSVAGQHVLALTVRSISFDRHTLRGAHCAVIWFCARQHG